MRTSEPGNAVRLITVPAQGPAGDAPTRAAGGDEAAVPLVLVHGLGIGHMMWDPVLDRLRQGRQVILAELPGHGDAEPVPDGVSINWLGQGLAAALLSRGHRRVLLCGHSLGGMVALSLAARRPDIVHRLVLAETALGLRTSAAERIGAALARPMLAAMPMRWIAAASASAYGRTPASRRLVGSELARMKRTCFLRLWAAVDAFDGRPLLAAVRCPTLVLVAEHNRRTHRQGQLTARGVTDGQLHVVPAASHLLTVDSPTAFADRVAAFLTEVG